MRKISIFLLFFISYLIGQNYHYNENDWYIIKNPGSINAITEDDFYLYFGTDNGIFIYDKIEENFVYDFLLSRQFYSSKIYHLIYDSYRDYFWVIHSQGINYKSSISSIWIDFDMSQLGIFNYNQVLDVGVSPDFVWIETITGIYAIEPLIGRVVIDKKINFDFELISWGSSVKGRAGKDFDISKYSINGDWIIDWKFIKNKNGQKINISLYMIDSRGNIWFGTKEGYLLRGWEYSSRLDVLKIGLAFDHITSTYKDKLGNWWFGDSYFKRTGVLTNEANKMEPFVIQWNENENYWKYYFPQESISIQNSDINDILRIGNYVYFATMYGLLYLDIFHNDWYLIDHTMGLNDPAIWKIVNYNNNLLLGTASGINELSVLDHQVINTNDKYKILDKINVLDIIVSSDDFYFSTSNGLVKMSIQNNELSYLSKKTFYKISFDNNVLSGADGDLWFIKDNEEIILSDVYDYAICDKYIWINHGDKVSLLDTILNKEWEYGEIDGIPGTKIYNINCDNDWVWFSTNQGLAFYNWSEYHYNEK